MKHSKLWTGLSSVVAILLVVSILATQCMLDYASTINQALGISTSQIVNNGDSDEDLTYYESEYGELNAENLQLLIADTYEEAVTEEAEGAVLLKNEDNALPLTSDETRVTLFGHAVAQPLYKNSSAGSSGYEGEYCIDLYTALTDAGFAINDTLYDAYVASDTSRGAGGYDWTTGTTSEADLGEEDISFYTDELQASWADDYNDVAIVMFSREAGEGLELEQEDSYEGISELALHQEEKDLLQMINDSGVFDKIIVLINSGNAMELNWLDEYNVDACLWIGLPGQRGFEAVADILTGETNPSGHLTDTYAVNSLSAPAVVNASYNNQTWTNLDEVLEAVEDADAGVSYYDVQAEGIYVGYKYYETRYEDTVLGQGGADSTVGSSTGSGWNYTDEVQYPFGYGLSYTTFEQTLDSVVLDGDDITVTVTVTNTGTVAGKSTVQVYAQTPYGDYEKENLVEKSAIQLLDFGKTDTLEPGESQTLEIVCERYLLASYDYTNAEGYILSAGDYYISIGDDAHDALNNVLAAKGATGMVAVDGTETDGDASKTYTWTLDALDTETYRYSSATGEEVTNQFDDCDINYWAEGTVTYLTRQDWEGTYPTEATQVTLDDAMIDALAGYNYEKAEDAASISDYTVGDNQGIPLAAMIGLDYDDPEWDTYLNQFTIEELCTVLADNFGTAEITSVGKPSIVVGDGPDGVGGTFDATLYGDDRDDCCFPCQVILASTFNKELLYNRANLMAEECLYLGYELDWMPGANVHRTPFGGRNFEYYSEDSTVGYICAAIEVEAMESKGVHAGMKHFAGNDQEENREGIAVFFNEQTFREGSLRVFEKAAKESNMSAIMHAFNRIGFTWCSTSSALLTQVLENEWGFVGVQETDATGGATDSYKAHYVDAVVAGTDVFCLDFTGVSTSTLLSAITENDDGDLLGMVRKSVHDYLYAAVNSNIMNGSSADSVIESITPWWQPTMYAIIAVCAVLEVLCLAMMLRKNLKKNPDKEA